MKKNSILIIADGCEAIDYLASVAAVYGDRVTLIYGGQREAAKGAAVAYYLGDLLKTSFAAFVPQIAKLAAEQQPELIITRNSRNGRLAAGTVAAALNSHILTDISTLTLSLEIWSIATLRT